MERTWIWSFNMESMIPLSEVARFILEDGSDETVRLHAEMKHKNILFFIGVFQTREDARAHITNIVRPTITGAE